MSATYRKKPEIVDAMRLTADNAKDVCDWIHRQTRGTVKVTFGRYGAVWVIADRPGAADWRVKVGDWVVRDASGTFLPCSPDVFDATYDSASPHEMTQTAPYPHELADLVRRVRYRPGWTVRLNDDCHRDSDPDGRTIGRGLTLIITTRGYNSYYPERGEWYGVLHYRIVPAATYGRQAWRRWLFEQFVDVERHEAMEFFALVHDDLDPDEVPPTRGSGGGPTAGPDRRLVRPFRPTHGPGWDPYALTEVIDDLDVLRRTRPDGDVVT